MNSFRTFFALLGDITDPRCKEGKIYELATLHAPQSPYGWSKSIAEKYLIGLEAALGLRVGVMRLFNVAGVPPHTSGNSGNKETGLLDVVALAALNRVPAIPVFGTDYSTVDGTCVRDYVHITDVSQAIRLGANYLTRKGGFVLNVGTGIGVSVREAVAAAERSVGRRLRVVIKRRRLGDVATSIACCENIHTQLGWHPKSSKIDEIIRDTIAQKKLALF